MVAAKVGRECAHDLYPQEVREFLDSAWREDTETGLFVRYVGRQECSVCANGGEVVGGKRPWQRLVNRLGIPTGNIRAPVRL